MSEAAAREEERPREGVASVVESSHLDLTRALLRALVGEGAGPPRSSLGVITLPRGWLAPPRVAAASCVYAIALVSVEGNESIYVGETDSLDARLAAHRSGWSGALRDGAQSGDVVIAPVASKSEARRLEAELIARCQQSGVALRSTHDGFHRSFGGTA